MTNDTLHDQKILILDFGSQYTQNIARKVRECHVYCEIHPYFMGLEKISRYQPKGIILSGGPASVLDREAPVCDPEIFKLKTPILGIVENMSFYICSHCGERDDIFGHGGAQEASREMGLPFLGEIPLSTEIRLRSDSGSPTALSQNQHGQVFQSIASAVAAQISIANHRAVQVPTIEP